LLLTMLAASLALLAQPSSASTLESYDIRAAVRYGCAQDDGEDNFVEVTLSVKERKDDDHPELMLQVGLAGPESPDSPGVYPEGGPSLVTLGEDRTKVRLAGPVHDGDHVFLRQPDRSEIITLPLQASCHRIKPTNFGLDEPQVRVSAQTCTSGSQANLKVTLANPNDVDRRLQKIGIEQIDYTVLLVRQDGLLAGTEPVGTLISFDEPSASVITLSQVVVKPASYQVRVIGLDGSVVTSRSIRLSCASTGRPSSSSPVRPTPGVPTSASPTAVPSVSRPAPSTPSQTPSATVTHPPTTPAPSSTAASSSPASSVPASPATSTPAQRPPTSSAAGSPQVPSASNSSSRAGVPSPVPSRPATSTPSKPRPSSSAPAGPATSSPAPSPEPSAIQLVEPRANYGGLPMFQKDIALVLLAFSAGMAALVGATVVNARRR
jgi:hypothetical protein